MRQVIIQRSMTLSKTNDFFGTYTLDREAKEIRLNFKTSKVRDGIKIFFYRGEAQSEEPVDYPVAYTDCPKDGVLDWPFDEYKIFQVLYRRPKLGGLLGHRWEVLTEAKHEKENTKANTAESTA